MVPSPTSITKNIAQIRDGKLLKAAKMRRMMTDVRNVPMFLAAKSAIGREIVIASIVDTKAI